MREEDRMNPVGEPIRIEIYGLLRERFAPLARFGGPLFAGLYKREGIGGGFYVDQLKRWLWLPDSAGRFGPEDAFLSDEAVAGQTDLKEVAGNLIRNARLIFDLYLEHLERIANQPEFAADLGVYLTDEAALVVDAIATRGKGRAG
jgi:hypothetical protein